MPKPENPGKPDNGHGKPEHPGKSDEVHGKGGAGDGAATIMALYLEKGQDPVTAAASTKVALAALKAALEPETKEE
jgi:hypothetical protein